MSIDVNWDVIDFNKELRNTITRQLQYLLERYRAVAIRVRVRFSDINGPRGGFDKKCVVSLKLRQAGEIIIKGKGMNYLEVFHASFERLVCSMRREIVKQREKQIRINRRKMSQ